MNEVMKHIMAEVGIETVRTSSVQPALAQFCLAETLDGTTVHVELTQAQTMLAGDSWQDERVMAIQDHGGELAMHDVRLGDLTNLRPESHTGK